MTDKELAIAVINIIPVLSLQELEEGLVYFIEDIEKGLDLTDAEMVFPHIIAAKLDFYEKEY